MDIPNKRHKQVNGHEHVSIIVCGSTDCAYSTDELFSKLQAQMRHKQKELFASCDATSVKIFDINTLDCVATIPTNSAIGAIHFLNEQEILVIQQYTLNIWNIWHSKHIQAIQTDINAQGIISVSMFAIFYSFNKMGVLNTKTSKIGYIVAEMLNEVRQFRDSQCLSTHSGRVLRFWDLTTLECTRVIDDISWVDHWCDNTILASDVGKVFLYYTEKDMSRTLFATERNVLCVRKASPTRILTLRYGIHNCHLHILELDTEKVTMIALLVKYYEMFRQFVIKRSLLFYYENSNIIMYDMEKKERVKIDGPFKTSVEMTVL